MRADLFLAADFGVQLADGERAAEYRMSRVEPSLGICELVILDFSGVRSANSSFVNGLVAGVLEQHGAEILQKLRFKGCNPTIKVLVEAAISLGLKKSNGRIHA